VIGSGPNRMEIYPMHQSATERLLYAYFPEKKILYAPDVIQVSGGRWFGLNLVREMSLALSRDGIRPASAFAFHSGLIPVVELEKAVQNIR